MPILYCSSFSVFLFPVRVVKHWNRLPRELVDVPLLGMFKGQVGWGSEQPDLVQVVPAHCEAELDWMTFKGPF